MKVFKKAMALLLAFAMIIQPLSVSAAITSKPADGTTTSAPFAKGTAGSNSFRIPSLVTLSDGTLVAAADARWNTTYDGGGLDTIVSRSSDNGASWNYTFANYLGDNGIVYNGSESTCFIDPAMAVTSNNTIYMLVDLYPYGVALNGDGSQTAPSKDLGFDNKGRLLLSNNNHDSYEYYLDNGNIYNTSGTEVDGYEVDDHFNITWKENEEEKSSNLFFSDSPFQVVRTGYLYLTKSTDNGETWSAPTLLNLKTSLEQVCLVGPGRGLVTSSGMIVFPVYSYNGSEATQKMSFIYSTDGSTWKRSDSFTGATWSSESAVVVLTDGTLRFFYRNGTSHLCYVDYSNGAWGETVNTDIATNSNCQISAITYSKTVDGKQVILVSCPTGPNEAGSSSSVAKNRLNGKIFVGLVDDQNNNTMTWMDNPTSVTENESQFMYSCLTELKDGSIAILYENYESKWGTGTDCYYTMDFQTYNPSELGLSVDSSDLDNENSSNGNINDAVTNEPTTTNTEDVTLEIGESQTFTDETGNYESNESNIYGDTTIAKVDVKGETVVGGTVETQEQSLVSGTAYYIKNSKNQYLTAEATWEDDLSDAVKWTYKEESIGPFTSKWLSYNNSYLKYSNNNISITTNSYEKTSWTVSNGKFQYTPWGSDTTYILGSAYSIITTEPVNKTTISITGVKPGTTKAIIGDTTYNIIVNKKQVSATISVGSSATFDDASEKILSNTNSNVATAKIAEGKLTVTALKEGTTTITTEYGIYAITVNDGTPISIKENESKILTLDNELADDQYVVWTTDNNKYVSVANNYNSDGADSNSGIIIGNTVTESPVVVTGYIYNEDGAIVSTQKWLVTVEKGDASDNTTTKYIKIDIDRIQNCTVYYSINGGELIEITNDMLDGPYKDSNGTYYKLKVSLMDEQYTGKFQISFFAAPDEGYALTYMSSTNSDKEYYCLSNGNKDGVGSSAWPFQDEYDWSKFDALTSKPDGNDTAVFDKSVGVRWGLAQGNFTVAQMKVMFANAIAQKCDGVLVFTKNDNGTSNGSTSNFGDNDLVTTLTFVAQKLPDVQKEITSISREGKEIDYTTGTRLKVGDKINYTIKVIKPNTVSTYGDITYSNVVVTDTLTQEEWNDFSSDSTTGNYTFKDIEGNDVTLQATYYTYTTSLTLSTNNFSDIVKDGVITNTANLSYEYKSQYSTGTLSATASAVAEITVDVPSYVIDFGLPVTFDISELDISIKGKLKTATATYGETEINGTNIKYTPNSVLLGTDYINLTYDNGETYAIAIYPATTVYYEEYFAEGVSGAWNSFLTKTNLTQAAEEVGEAKNVYGYDAAYNPENGTVGASNGTSAVSDKASVATFTFKGTGIDIYTNNTTSSGVLMAWVKDLSGNTVKVITVDTHMANGESSYTSGQAGDAYNVPVISLTGLERDNYTVELRHIGQSVDGNVVYNPVSLDGFRVHGTIDYATDAYVQDSEDNPTFVELRDKVLAGLKVDLSKSIYAEDIATDTLAQVYAKENGTNGAVLFSSYDVNSEENDVQDLLDNGPKNELYLRENESVVFKVTTNRVTQIGLKALNGNIDSLSIWANGTVITDAPTSLNTSTDMFYKLSDKKNSAEEVTYTITNNSENILSITELKICDDPNVTFEALTEEDLIPALLSLGFESEVTYADASLAISINDAEGNALVSTALTANGVVGETATFAATDIQAAVEALELSENYKLDTVVYEDVEVAYGESGEISFTATEEVIEPEEPDDNTSGNTGSFIDKIFDAIKNFFNGFWK